MIAEIMVDLKTTQIESTYDYTIPEDLMDFLKVGQRVVIPFNNTTRVGLIIGIKESSKVATKSIIEPFDLEPILNKEQLHLINYLEQEAMIPKHLAYFKVVPNALQIEYKKQIKVLNREALTEPLKSLLVEDINPYQKDWSKYSISIKKAEQHKWIQIEEIFEQKRSIRMESFYKQTHKKPNTPKQLALWNFLSEPHNIDSIIEGNFTKTMVKQMVVDHTLKETKIEKLIAHESYETTTSKTLTKEQNSAIETIKPHLKHYRRFLLKGVSASGKTEIFLQLCLKQIEQKKQVMIITIDEALIDQMADYLSPYMKVAKYHNDLSLQKKLDGYRASSLGYTDVLITTPTGVFTPFKNLGLIIADECQDQSYIDYQKTVHGLDVLVERAQYHNIPLIYATATPAVHLLYDAQMGKLDLIELSEKVYQTKDQLTIVDMRKELESGNLTMLSKSLQEAINQALNDKEQALILVNKSGYSSYVLCRSCGYVPMCERCDSPLVYHKSKQRLICHHCGFKKPEIHVCDVCHSDKIRPVGIAIEQVETHLKKTYPMAKIARLDADTTTSKGTYVKTIQAFKNKEIDILVGTQLISKGHDFDIPVVGILLIDSMLKAPTYLANEKTYQLIKQTLGRAGRKRDSQSIIQTYVPDHFVMKTIQDEQAFYEQELNRRLLGNYPPYTQLLTLIFKGQSGTIEKVIDTIKQNILARYSQYKVIGPSEYQKEGYKLMIKTPKRQDLSHLVNYIKTSFEKPSLSIDFYRYDDEV